MADRQARNRGITALEQASFCVARATSCDEGLKLWKKKYAPELPNMSGVDKAATESWGTLVDQKRVVCK